MRVQFFSYVLNPTKQGTLFGHRRDKMDIFKETLPADSQPLKFKGYGNTTLGLVLLKQIDRFLVFRLGKGEKIRIHKSPDEGFMEQTVEDWPSTLLFVDTDDSPKGHRIAVQYNHDVFSHPHVPLEALQNELNKTLFDEGYALTINPLTKQQKFWDVVERNENQIQKVTLSFNAPNFLQLNTSLNAAMKKIQEKYGATKAEFTLENPAGGIKIPRSDRLVKEGTEYIGKGQGSYSFKVKSRRSLIKEKDIVETVEIDIDVKSENDAIILETLKKLFEDKKDE